MASLCYKDAAGTGRRYELAHRAAIGRHPAQDIQVLDRVVSKEHALVEFREGGYWVTDVGSRNGTYLNGKRIDGSRSLTDGDEITIGSTTIRFEAVSPRESLADRVTVHGGVESAIRTRMSTREALGFLPESNISDIEVLRADYEKLRIANELNQALSLEFDLDQLLHKILDRAFTIFRCDRGVILIQDETTNMFVPFAARLRKNRDATENIRISETILREVIEKHQAILSSDAMMDSRFQGSHSIIMEGIRSTMSVPLLYQDKLLGIIHLDSQVAAGAFSEKDLHLLSGFARQAAISIEHASLITRMRAEALNREKLGRLLSPELVDAVIEGTMDIRKGGDLKRATVMFADIRGFTPMSERYPPQEIVAMLNEYFEIMVDVVFQTGGTLDKFIGDAIMAIWGAPFSKKDDAFRAVAAAMEMQGAMMEFNETRRQDGQEAIRVGIGLSTGEAVAGYMGSSRALHYTVVGDAVNTAARVCDVAGPGQVVVTRATAEEIGDRIEVRAL
ncbi:MAG: FHA domain-containing protein, partial [Myxococcales bacterium]|nr:FHA domain-containing protein [Myxococcales bacterium]